MIIKQDESIVKQCRLNILFAVRTLYLLTKGTVILCIIYCYSFFSFTYYNLHNFQLYFINCVSTHKNTLQTYGLNINPTTVKLSTLEHLNISQYYSKNICFNIFKQKKKKIKRNKNQNPQKKTIPKILKKTTRFGT